MSSAAATESAKTSVSSAAPVRPSRLRRLSSSTKASNAGRSETHVRASTTPEATAVPSRALTRAHHRPSVTTPTGTPTRRRSSSTRSIGLAAQPSPMETCRESTGSTTSTSAPTWSPLDSAPVAVTVTVRSGEVMTAVVPGPAE